MMDIDCVAASFLWDSLYVTFRGSRDRGWEKWISQAASCGGAQPKLRGTSNILVASLTNWNQNLNLEISIFKLIFSFCKLGWAALLWTIWKSFNKSNDLCCEACDFTFGPEPKRSTSIMNFAANKELLQWSPRLKAAKQSILSYYQGHASYSRRYFSSASVDHLLPRLCLLQS